MDLTNITAIKSLCKQYGLYPSSVRGQNFLINRDVLNNMVAAADLKKDDIILEVGPGFGVLTLELAKKVKKVIAIEQDKILIKALRENLEKEKINNVEIIEGNVLKLPTTHYQLLTTNYRIVSNLPYQITSRFLRQFLEAENKPQDMTVMVQKEVAQRIVAKPGDMSLLAISVQFYGEPKIVRNVSKDCFWPEPEVDSSILRIAQIGAEKYADRRGKVNEKAFFKIVRNGFLHRR
ncbi:ribosomal RNA small subunit methyltransferase A, partial [Patescibacteria group bacterium]